MPEQYCVGPAMATDWGEQKPQLTRRLLGRVFSYFLPYWSQALVVLACIAAGAALGLVPALVTKGLLVPGFTVRVRARAPDPFSEGT